MFLKKKKSPVMSTEERNRHIKVAGKGVAGALGGAGLGGALGTAGAHAYLKKREKNGKKNSTMRKVLTYGASGLVGTSLGGIGAGIYGMSKLGKSVAGNSK